MRAPAALWINLMILVAALAAHADESAASRSERIRRIEGSIAGVRNTSNAMSQQPYLLRKDQRQRTHHQDFAEYVASSQRLDRLEKLLVVARTGGSEQAAKALDDADAMRLESVELYDKLVVYWTNAPLTPLAGRWKAFTAANRYSGELDPQILLLEKRMLESMRSGDVSGGSAMAAELQGLMSARVKEATNAIARSIDPAKLSFVPRASSCPGNSGVNKSGRPFLKVAVDPDAYFPADAKLRGETGEVVVRAKIAPSNCGSDFAVVVSSGYPALDAAAIKVAEAGQYLAGVEQGKPVPGEITFKIVFIDRG